MHKKLFFWDSFSNKSYTYDDLFNDIIQLRYLNRYVYTNDYYNIFKNIVCSLIHDCPIILLDYDFSNIEIENLGITKEELTSGYDLKNINELTPPQMITSFNNTSKWRITLYTSGTTGLPKRVSHTFQNVTRMVKKSSKMESDIWGFSYNPTHIAGLQVFFQALLNNNSIITLFGQSRSKIYELIEQFHITNISATPTFFRMLLPIEKPYNSVKRITSGGEKFDNKFTESLLTIFPNAKILNVYASTEAGTVLAANGDLFQIKDALKKMVKIVDNELFINNKLLGYTNSIELNDNWYNTGDIVEIVENDPLVFRFVGRKNELINVGGYKVNPLEIESVINSHPNIKISRVFAKKNSVIGNVLCADIVIKKDISEKTLKDFLNKKIQNFKIPRIINIVDSIEATRTGKIKR